MKLMLENEGIIVSIESDKVELSWTVLLRYFLNILQASGYVFTEEDLEGLMGYTE